MWGYLAVVCVLGFVSSTGAVLLEGTVTTETKIDMLQVLLTEEKQLRMKLEATVEGLSQQMANMQTQMNQCSCESAGARRPAFMAGLSADLDHCSLGQPVIFDSVKVNVGNGYSNVHGIFTPPIAGTYAFAASLTTMPHQQYHVAIVKGNSTNEIGYLYTDPSNIWLGRSTTILTHLNQGEEVWMVCLGDSRIEGDHQHSWGGAGDYHSHMSGFLVSEDEDLYNTNVVDQSRQRELSTWTKY